MYRTILYKRLLILHSVPWLLPKMSSRLVTETLLIQDDKKKKQSQMNHHCCTLKVLNNTRKAVPVNLYCQSLWMKVYLVTT